MPDRIRFFGGTALSRSFLTSGRFSEDIDLIAIGPRPEIAELVTTTLTHSLAREFGRPTFVRSLVEQLLCGKTLGHGTRNVSARDSKSRPIAGELLWKELLVPLGLSR